MAFNKIGKVVSDKDIQETFKEFDKAGNGQIDREEWRAVMDEIISSTQNF